MLIERPDFNNKYMYSNEIDLWWFTVFYDFSKYFEKILLIYEYYSHAGNLYPGSAPILQILSRKPLQRIQLGGFHSILSFPMNGTNCFLP